MKTIDQFMWGFQHYFRWHVEYETQRVLKEIGMPVEGIQVVLVGIAMEEGARHAICVEPETGHLCSEHLAQVASRAIELYQSDPESNIIHSHPLVHEARERGIFHKARANAITEAIEKSGAFRDFTFFVSQSSPINGYEVHTCIGIPTSVIGNLPAFKESTVERFHAGQSLPHEVIRECLHRADKALYLPDPGAGLSILGRTEDIVTSSTEGFISGITWRTVREPSDLFGALNAIASLTYERAGAMGSLIVTSHENLEKWLKVRFKKPVRLQESRTMRKVIQLSDSTMSVLADNHYAYGLGPGKTAPDIIEVSITGHTKWEASVNGDKYVRVTYGKATIPSQPIEIEDNGKSSGLCCSRSGKVPDAPRSWTCAEWPTPFSTWTAPAASGRISPRTIPTTTASIITMANGETAGPGGGSATLWAGWKGNGKGGRRNPPELVEGAIIIDSQSVKTAGAGGVRGYDAGKKV